jgi:hypothetical protein
MYSIGVTGTERGATKEQLLVALSLIDGLVATHDQVRVCQGCCIGFDEEITVALKHRYSDTIRICAHPPLLVAKLSTAAVKLADVVQPPFDYLTRDRKIVLHGRDYVIGAPEGFTFRSRGSGTWYTVNHAVTQGRTVDVVYPDGTKKPGREAVKNV